MPFFVSAESGVHPVSEARQTEPAAIGLALDYVDGGFSEVEIREANTGAIFAKEFLLAYSINRGTKKKRGTPVHLSLPVTGDQAGRLGVSRLQCDL
jgi:hypothetical protein